MVKWPPSPRSTLSFAVVVLVTILVVYPLVRTGCDTDRQPWHIDAEYSENLTIMAGMSGALIADTVDVLRIYRIPTRKKDMYSLSALFKKDLVYETSDKQRIKQFILSAQDTIMDVPWCYQNQDQETFHVIALDNKLMRAGYFIYSFCTVKEGRYGIVTPLQKGGGSNIYYNKALVPILEDIVMRGK